MKVKNKEKKIKTVIRVSPSDIKFVSWRKEPILNNITFKFYEMD